MPDIRTVNCIEIALASSGPGIKVTVIASITTAIMIFIEIRNHLILP
jgi:hypothetical protein